MLRDVERAVRIERQPEEPGEFRGGQLGQFRGFPKRPREPLLAGYPNQIAVQVVGPRVVGAGQPARSTATVGYPGLTVQADVLERLDRAVLRSRHQDRPS